MQLSDILLRRGKVEKLTGRERKKKLLKLFQRDGEQCFYCQVDLTIKTATIDHVIPRSQGGLNELWNLVAACFPCNHTKNDHCPTGRCAISKFKARYKNWSSA